MNFNTYKNLFSSEISIYLGVALFTLIFYFIFIKNKKSYKLPPGPIGLPIVGYLPFLGKKPHRQLYELSKKYGNVMSLYLGQNLMVVLSDWTATEEAFNKTETTDRPTGIFEALPNGLGFGGTNGKEWLDTRRMAVKTMRDVGLGRPQWENLLREEVDEVIKMIKDSKGQHIDVRKIFSTTFTNNMITLLLDKRHPFGDKDTEYISSNVDYIVEQFGVISWANYFPKFSTFLIKSGLFGSKGILKKLKEFSRFMEKYIDREMETTGLDDRTFIGIFNKEVEKQKNNPDTFYTKKSFYGNTQGIIFGGAETTRTAMVWLLKNMAKHQDVQKKVHEELDSVLGRYEKVSWSERDRVPYTFCTIMESLRQKSMVPLNTLRMANADIKIQGYDIPKGTYITINQWALHNDPKYWPEPRKFKPERFMTKENKINHSADSFVTFSIGRRSCPGRNIALMELLEYFIAVMQNFTVLPPENGFEKYDTIYGLTYQAMSMSLRFIPREEDSASNT